MVELRDENMHEPGSAPDWQESFYFNWFDANSDAMGLARIGYRPHDKTCDGLLYTMRGGRIERGYAKIDVPYSGIPDPRQLAVGHLDFRMIEAMSRWELRLRGRDEVDLTWTALNAPFDFHNEAPPGAVLPSGFADAHMEQSGRVIGRVKMRGVEYLIDGLGQRDKSWGVREWGRIEGWNWVPVLFGPDLMMNCTQIFSGGRAYPSGYIFHDSANHAVKELTVDYAWASHRVPDASRIVATDVSGFRIEVRGRASAQSVLYRKGLVIQESASRFDAVVDGEHRSGVGLTEHAWHGGAVGTLRTLPRLAATVSRIAR
jgi:hypothetical protein